MLKNSQIKYKMTGKKIWDKYQMEISESWLQSHSLPKGQYITKSKTKALRRFSSDIIVALLKRLEAAMLRKEIASSDAARQV